MSHQGRSTHESAPPFKRTYPYSCFEGNAMGKSKASPPVACQENGHENILFTDEKNFTNEEQYNQYNKIRATTSLEVHFEVAGRPHHPSCVMVWWEVSHQGVTSSFLQEKGETGVQVYQEDVLQGVVKHHNMAFFIGQEWVLQQDSVPAQKTKTTQEWLQRNFLAFFSTENWLSGSADLKPWTKNCGLFLRAWLAKSVTMA